MARVARGESTAAGTARLDFRPGLQNLPEIWFEYRVAFAPINLTHGHFLVNTLVTDNTMEQWVAEDGAGDYRWFLRDDFSSGNPWEAGVPTGSVVVACTWYHARYRLRIVNLPPLSQVMTTWIDGVQLEDKAYAFGDDFDFPGFELTAGSSPTTLSTVNWYDDFKIGSAEGLSDYWGDDFEDGDLAGYFESVRFTNILESAITECDFSPGPVIGAYLKARIKIGA